MAQITMQTNYQLQGHLILWKPDKGS